MLRTLIGMTALICGTVNASPVPDFDVTAIQRGVGWERGEQAAQESLQGLQQPSRRFSGIADDKMEGDWLKLREALGINTDDQLYIFVSFSMPESLIRAYALDAAYTGATLVFRGIDDETDLRSFVFQKIMPLVHAGETGTPIQIDPRLFDVFGVKQVPSIVLAKTTDAILCETGTHETGLYQEEPILYPKCTPMEPDTFWLLSGAVTTQYALQTFKQAGADSAQDFLKNLSTGYVHGSIAGEEDAQQRQGIEENAFKEELKWLAERNAEILRERYQDEKTTVYSTPWGPATGPKGLDMPVWEKGNE